MDLGKLEKARLDAEVPERLELLQKDGTPYPDDDGLGRPWVMVKGSDCQAVREVGRRILGKTLATLDDDTEDNDVFARNLDPAVRIPRAAAAITEMGGVGVNGEALESNYENIVRLISFEHHLGQVEKKMREHGRPFTKPSSDSSPTPGTSPASENSEPTAGQ